MVRWKKEGGEEDQRRGEQKGKGHGEKEENEIVSVKKKGVLILPRLRPSTFLGKGRIWRDVVILGVTSGMILVGCLTVIPGIGRVCLRCLL